jgi:hypothetical protein
VRQLSACLGSLPVLEARYLALRAGLYQPPLSQRAVAQRLGISAGRAPSLERSSLRSLREAARSRSCVAGALTGTNALPLVIAGASSPQLQPAVLLEPPSALLAASPPRLAVAASPPRLARPARQRPRGATKPGRSDTGVRAVLPTAIPSAVARTASSALGPLLIAGLALLTLLTGALLVRRRARRPDYADGGAAAASPPVVAAVAPAAHEQAAERQAGPPAAAASSVVGSQQANRPSEPQAVPPAAAASSVVRSQQAARAPSPQASPTQRRTRLHRMVRPVAIAASGLVSVAASRLLRGRRGARGARQRRR